MVNNLWEESRQKDSQIREKNDQIRELNRGMESGSAHVMELQKELNDYKEKYFNLQIKQNEAKNKVQQLEWNVQQHSGISTEIGKLKEYIQKIEPQLINYQGQIQQLVNELNQTKQSAVTEHNKILEASRQEIMDLGNAEHE